VQPARFRVDVRRDGVGAQDMTGEGVELRGAIAEEEREGYGWEGVAVGVVGRVGEHHFASAVQGRRRVEVLVWQGPCRQPSEGGRSQMGWIEEGEL